MLFQRTAYVQIGGHAAVRGDVADDVALGRLIVRKGLRWALTDATERIHCRMYHSFEEAWSGFSKNMFAGFGYRLIPYMLIWAWCALLFWEPLVVISLAVIGQPPAYFPLDLAVTAYGLGLFAVGNSIRAIETAFLLGSIPPAGVHVCVRIAMNALLSTIAGGSSWKGRKVRRAKIRLF